MTHVYTRSSSRVGWMDGGGERLHARPNALAFARALDGRLGYGETSPSTSARAIYARGICMRTLHIPSIYAVINQLTNVTHLGSVGHICV